MNWITDTISVTLKAIYLLAFSWHNVCDTNCNQNNNPVIGVDIQHSTGQYTLLTLPNSHNNQSVLISKREKYFFYGAVTGYEPYPVPFIAPKLSIGPADISCLSDLERTVCTIFFKWRL
jgi:hypothetical protein